ncbi:GTP cyclohydrolase I [Ornithinimicrobium cryptoxanthini]|uniref:GTP cyclohydrolase 1 n=1 Tax=Ornithinimicrobium cryptoxanthini TaxID=2934161 RepID=A0ABY4YLS0_9MICO|nr:GTP cyclohydrolase I [Ornithinimicrobium cryptoxanthini]USQ77639.1 GTP cyclohydrolase I [Ornithinimicrobium cryptoxanthini]
MTTGTERSRAPLSHETGWAELATDLPVPASDHLDRATRAAADFLAALGVDCDTTARAASPRRMARAYAAMLTARPFEMTTFDNDEGYDELVLVKSIPVQSLCEHHFLPFTGTAHVGYLPGSRILGLSKFARVVEMFARRPQVQERLTQQVADWIDRELQPRGVGVVIEAEHTCMTLRGVRAAGTTTRTSALRGSLRETAQRAEFFSLIH